MKITTLSVAISLLLSAQYLTANTTPTPFAASIVNNSEQSLYITLGALPDQTHTVVAPGNAMMCPVFASSSGTQTLQWNLDPSLFSPYVQSPDIEVNFYTAAGLSPTSPQNQSNPCAVPSTLQAPGKAYPPGGIPIACTNTTDPSVKYGGVKFSSYHPGILTIASDGNGGLTCTLNAYTYTSEPIPYVTLHAGENDLPPEGSTSNSSPLPTADSALIDLGSYMGNMNGNTPVTIIYSIASGLSQELIINGTDAGPQTALLQIKNGQIFVQHNIGTSALSYASLQKKFCPNGPSTAPSFCTVYVRPGQTTPAPDKFVLWPTLTAQVITGPSTTDTTTISQTFPIVISNAIRAKTVTELINQRMAQLVLNTAQGKTPAISDDTLGDVQGTWLANHSTTTLNSNLMPDGANPITPDIKDYLAVSATPNDASSINLDLSQYFVSPAGTEPTDPIQYSLDASYLQLDPVTAANYGYDSAASLAPIAYITGIGQVTPIAGTTPAQDQLGYSSAGPFTIKQNLLTVTGTLPNQGNGVYQINVRAYDTKTNESAFNTFYLYLSNDAKATTYSQWQSGSEPSFSVLSYAPGQKFGTAYLYTSHDFTKSYDQQNWETSIKTLLGDISTADNTYHANIESAFVDVNNLSFQNNMSYWPLSGNPDYQDGNVESSMTSSAMQTNLSYTNTSGQSVYLLQPLLDFLSQNSNGPQIALTVYPSNNLKADFTGFNDQQRKIFADMSAIPAIASLGTVDGISVDLEGGLNSTGDTQFYKLLADELAYNGKWFSFFYFATVASPGFVASLGPLGALEVSTYDVGTYREPGAVNFPDGSTQTIIPGTVPLANQGWSPSQTQALYSAYFKDTQKCDQVSESGGQYVLTVHSWCNNSTNQSYSENNRLWTSFIQANNLLYTDPLQNMALFNGKFHLVLPVSWSATQFTNLYLFNPDLTSDAEGLFMKNESNASDCANLASLTSIQACLFGNTDPNLGLPIQAVIQSPAGQPSYLIISSLPGTAKSSGSWSGISRQNQVGYMNTNISVYQDALAAAQAKNPALSTVNQINLAGLGAYALELFENVPSNVSANAQGISGSPTNAAMQTPWYVGFSPDTIPGTTLQPGYSLTDNQTIWGAFGVLMSQTSE